MNCSKFVNIYIWITYVTSGDTFDKKSPRRQNLVNLKQFEFVNIASIWQIWKDHMHIIQQKYVSWWWCTNDITVWRQKQPFIFMCKWNCFILSRTLRHTFTKFHPQVHLGLVQNHIDCQGQQSNNQVTRSQNISKWVKSFSIKRQYKQPYWLSNKWNINMIYLIAIIIIIIAMSIILANFGKYAISDCQIICL